MPIPSSVPPAPREPSALARRLVFRYQGSQFVLLLIGVIFLAMGVPMGAAFCWSLPVDLTIAATAKQHTGTVVSAKTNYNARVNGRHPVDVRYTYAFDGAQFEGSSDMLGDEYAALQPGSTIDLEVAASHPSWSRVAGGTYGFFGYFGAFTLIFPVVGGVLAFFAVRSNRREIRAFREGRPVTAKVTYAGLDYTTKLNGRHPFKLAWEFRADGSTLYTGSISSMREEDLRPLVGEGEVVVLFDPEDPSVNTLYVP